MRRKASHTTLVHAAGMPTCLLTHARTHAPTNLRSYLFALDYKGSRDDATTDGEGGEAGPPPPERLLLLTGPNASGK